ncbi:Indolepyruvate ferredoxin oxidoreductase, alpha/beta subunit [Desulfatibacillum aliphaticivorans]|uniref:Indolepyruvate oxidoreductase subunit IorA n=1 Tax=Desulfatibacillum aliphaticivorans TaxID=218208 RepID=B8FDS9_DESAL|nr:indolepyruvate ferredoxin oxidoreductase subunit alpha [Desulfatibacillum aliphaticivorans]ACL06710.1 Indolepyruvate ferredoxin oxidoreductase, alpha/beta subunit [Desulfatibacillum aliphaticivorans]
MHKLLLDQPGKEMLVLGNEAIARGAVEAGVACATTYPGTPSSELSLAFFQMSKESDLYFEYSTNEKVALEVAAAAANAGIRSMCVMKHVGVNVAADALMTLAYIGVKAGMVLLTADDPFMFSSQNEQDNRYYGKMAGLCVLEPSSLPEAKAMATYAFELSEKLGEPVILRTTTRINHSTGAITLGELVKPNIKGSFTKDPFNLVAIPAVSRRLHTRLLQRLAEAEKITDQTDFNYVQGEGAWGIVCNGVSYNYVCDALNDLGVAEKVSILRIGFSNPMPVAKVTEFLKGKEKILVAEEGEPFMEEAVRSMAQEVGCTIPIKGKGPELFSREGEFDPAGVRKAIAGFFGVDLAPAAALDLSDLPEIPARPPNLCAGCTHRAVFYEVKKAAEDMEIMHPTDIGCYTLGVLPPLSSADFLICMGSSISTGCGFSKFIDQKVVTYIGDSTFFHSGVPGLINAVHNNHNVTMVILDNGTTAMTGHQPNPGVDRDAMGQEGYNRISIENVVKGLGVESVTVIKPYKVQKSVDAIKEALAYQGVSVIIAQELCPLYAKALKRPVKKPFRIDMEKCKDHRLCVDALGCPAMYVENNKVAINAEQCIGCAVCAQVCPEHAIVPIRD